MSNHPTSSNQLPPIECKDTAYMQVLKLAGVVSKVIKPGLRPRPWFQALYNNWPGFGVGSENGWASMFICRAWMYMWLHFCWLLQQEKPDRSHSCKSVAQPRTQQNCPSSKEGFGTAQASAPLDKYADLLKGNLDPFLLRFASLAGRDNESVFHEVDCTYNQ